MPPNAVYTFAESAGFLSQAAAIWPSLRLQDCPAGAVSRGWLDLAEDGLADPLRIPMLVARGRKPGPTLALTAALHGNELNGIVLIQRLFAGLNLETLRGNVVGALVLNVPGYLRNQRQFNNGVDLNRIAPGSADGDTAQRYIHRICHGLLPSFDYLIDLHTASWGRVNSWYIRADMQQEATARMARLQNPEIILHNPPNDGTFRGAAAARGIAAITLELRDPNIFQFDVIEEALEGVRNVLFDLGMLPGQVVTRRTDSIWCDRSYWMYTDTGGLLEVLPQVADQLVEGQPIARITDLFGRVVRTYTAPAAGIVIGRSVNPVGPTGSRILHLGLHPQRVGG